MIRAVLVTIAGISLAFAISGRSATSTASPAEPEDVPTWLCCDYTCTTNGGPSHGTSFCHASSIGTECPNTPAPSDAAQQCVLISQRPSEGCADCVSP